VSPLKANGADKDTVAV